MPSFRTGRVTAITAARPGMQRLRVRLDGDEDDTPALNYPDVIGAVEIGDDVVCNTTAVELGLGTGGSHIVHWNLSRRRYSAPSGGHIMKARYTSAQVDVRAVEAQDGMFHDLLRDAESLTGMPVMAAGLHSLVAAAAAGFKSVLPTGRLVYVMTDAAALPLALSDLVADLVAAGFIAATITVGQAFGGDYESVTTASGLLAARLGAGADAAIVAMGPGVAGTGTRFGFSALEVAHVVRETTALDGRPIVVPRVAVADTRGRHRGVSHHTLRAIEIAGGAEVPVAAGADIAGVRTELAGAGAAVVEIEVHDALDMLTDAGISPTTMGRGIADDPLFWECGAAAGARAAALAGARP